MSPDYRNFLALSYEELEELNLQAKADRMNRLPIEEVRDKRIKYLTDQKHIKAVTVLFSDLEGRLHLLDYDKKFLLGAHENLTFDGSSIRGFTAQKESDLRLGHRLERVLLGAGRRVRQRQGAGLRHGHRQGRHSLLRRPARRAQGLLRQALQGEGLHAQRGQRN